MSRSFFVIGGGAKIRLEYITRVASGANADSYTFNDVLIGDPSDDRYVIVAAIQTNSGNFESRATIKINDAAATHIAGFLTSSVKNVAGIAFMLMPAGTTAKIVVDIFGGNDCTIFVWTLRNVASPYPFDESYVSGTGTSSALTFSIPRDGVALYVGGQRNGEIAAWSSASLIDGGAVESSYVSAAEKRTQAELLDHIETRSWTTSNLASMIGLSFEPSNGLYPAVQGREAVRGIDVASVDVPLPGGIAAGDLLLVTVALGGGNARTLSTPAGWTEVFNQVGGGNLRRFACYSRIADGSEGATVTVVASGKIYWSVESLRISKASSVEAALAAGSSSGPNPPLLAPSWGARPTLWLAVAADVVNNATDPQRPLGYNQCISTRVLWLGTVRVGLATAMRRETTASQDPGQFTLAGSNNWIAATIAIR